MRIMVTGGAGFLGSNLCERLVERGDDVICMDNLSTGNTANIAGLFNEKNFQFICADSSRILPEIEVDQIYNLASPTAPGAYKKDPQGTYDANIIGTENMLKLAQANDAKVVQFSTIKVLEEVGPGSYHVPYIDGKREAEALCTEYHRKGTDVKIARLFNTYGPKMSRDDSRVVPQFVTRAIKKEPLLIVGEGKQRDSFCYVDDIIDGVIRLMDSTVELGPITFGYPETISILELAELVIKVVGPSWKSEFPVQWEERSRIVFNGIDRPERELEVKMSRPTPDIREPRELLGWEPKVSLKDGLGRLAEYFLEK